MDMLLTLVGLLLVVAGLLVFLFGRSRAHGGDGKNNVFEAFGIKLDVANPSILLIMFGVVLLLTPRFVPFDGDKESAQAVTEVVDSVVEAMMPAPEQSGSPQPAPAPQDAVSVPEDVVTAVTPPTPASAPAPAPTPTPTPASASASASKSRPAPAPVAEVSAETQRRVAELERAQPSQPESRSDAEPVSVDPKPAASPLRVGVFTEAFNYEGETDGSLRAKMQTDLRRMMSAMLGKETHVDGMNPGFRGMLRRTGEERGLALLCKRTEMDRLLLADLSPPSDPFGIESATWPEMRYTAVNCVSGASGVSNWMRMEPEVRDRYPMQNSLLKTGRHFMLGHRHLLDK